MLGNGLYSADFQTPLGAGAGVVVLRDGILCGGDSGLYYTGSYQQDGDTFNATVQTGRHTRGLTSVFGRDAVMIKVTGRSNGTSAELTGTSPQAPEVSFRARLRRLTD